VLSCLLGFWNKFKSLVGLNKVIIYFLPFAVLQVKPKLFYGNITTKKVLYLHRRNLLLNCNYSQMEVPAGYSGQLFFESSCATVNNISAGILMLVLFFKLKN